MEAHLRLRVRLRHSWWRWVMGVLLPLKMTLLIALLTAICLLAPCYADDNPGRNYVWSSSAVIPMTPNLGLGSSPRLLIRAMRSSAPMVPPSGVIDAFSGDPERGPQGGGYRRLQSPRCETKVLPLCPRETGCR